MQIKKEKSNPNKKLAETMGRPFLKNDKHIDNWYMKIPISSSFII